MKQVCTILFLYNYLFSPGQEPVSTLTNPHFEFSRAKPVKSKIYPKKGNAFMVAITKITDSVVIYARTGDTINPTGFDTIPVSEIAKMKIKRNAVEYGMLTGAAVGGLAGYGAGYISYSDDASVSDEDNQIYRDGRAIAGAIIGAVPGTLIGGMIGGVFTKRVFKINGNAENILRLVSVLDRKRPFN